MNDGGPAFARGDRTVNSDDDYSPGHDGMPLRDYLAAHAPDMPDIYYFANKKCTPDERYSNAERDEKL